MEPLVFEEVASPASNDELDAMPDQVAELARCAGTLARAFVREAMADAAAAGTEAESETLTMLLGVKPGKVVRLVGIAVPDWDPVLEGTPLIELEDAVILNPWQGTLE